MSDPDTRSPRHASPCPPGPVGRPVPCSNCGAPTDPLRAPRVAIYCDRFRYFCSAECHLAFDPETRLTPLPQPRRRRSEPPRLAEPVATTQVDEREYVARHQTAEALDRVAGDGFADLSGRNASAAASGTDGDAADRPFDAIDPSEAELRASDESGPATEVSALLLGLGALGGVLAVVLLLAGPSTIALTARVVLAAVGAGALLAEYAMRPRDPSEPHPVAMLAAPVVATGTAVVARMLDHSDANQAVTLAGVVVAIVAATQWLIQRTRRPIDAKRERIAQVLDPPSHRVVADEAVDAWAADLRPGEEIVVQPGEVVPADATIVAGTARVLPWLGARTSAPRGEGDSIVAGARVVSGTLRAVVGWAGYDRAWMRLTNDPRRRADLLAPPARAGRLLAERVAPLAAGLAALVAFAEAQNALAVVMIAVAAQTVVGNAVVAQIGALHVAQAVLTALGRGIVFRTADALDRAGRVSSMAFCARGTLLLGEPEVANIEPVGPHESQRVLALVAGAESGATHPVATAIQRAARDRGIRPDGVRSPTVQPGLGVTAIASSGQPIAVGSRALMLKERVSVASAEAKLTELEAMGRTVMLAALDGRLIGVLGLQDGLRPGARAAVQYLLDVGVEPVLLSGDARETCEALGRALDIDHIRPEVLPADRGEEIRRLADGGAVVAVVGHSPIDDTALGAADLSVALGAAGSSAAEWSVQLASDDVRDSAFAVRLAHRTRSEARTALLVALLPAAGAALAVAFTLLPPVVAPLVALGGGAFAVTRLRSGRS